MFPSNNSFNTLGDANDIEALVGDVEEYVGDAAKQIVYTPFIDIKGGVLTSAAIQSTSQFPLRERKEAIRQAQRQVAYPNYQLTAPEVMGAITFTVRSSDILSLAPTTAPTVLVPLLMLQVGISAYQGVPGGNYIVRIQGKDAGGQAFDSAQIVIAQSEAYSNLIIFTPWRLIAGNPYPIFFSIPDAVFNELTVSLSGLQTASKATLTVPGANHRAVNALLRS